MIQISLDLAQRLLTAMRDQAEVILDEFGVDQTVEDFLPAEYAELQQLLP